VKNLRIRGKLAVSFAIMLAILLGIGGLSIYNQSSMNRSSGRISGIEVPHLKALSTILSSLGLYRATESADILAALPDEIGDAEKKLNGLRGKIDASLQSLQSGALDDASRTQLTGLQGQVKAYMAKSDQLRDKARRNLDTDASDDYQYNEPAFNALMANAQKIADANAVQINVEAAAGQRTYSLGWVLTLMGLGIALASVSVLLATLLRAIARPLSEMTAVMGELASGRNDIQLPVVDSRDEVAELVSAMAAFRDQLAAAEGAKTEQAQMLVDSVGEGLGRLAQGDLLARIDADLSGPFAKLKTDFNNALQSLSETLGLVAQSSNGIRHGASDIRQASDDLSQRTEQQAASLERTASAMAKITATVKQTAEDATRANGAVGLARNEAEHGGEVVGKAVDAMAAIERASSEISEIISVIDGIAFQTNLLALNAGVEAARAGDAGKGFAVVASEVRALAQRSADAARDVKARITASSTQVGTGVQLVRETGQALHHIIDRIGEISGLVSSITTSAEQQASGLAQVNEVIVELDGVTQQNAAMVEEATAAARSLAGEAETLALQVGRFKATQTASREEQVSPARRLQERVATLAPRTATRRPAAVGNLAVAQEADDWSEF